MNNSGGAAPLITVAICTYNRHDLLPATIAAVQAQQGIEQASYDILIVDNSPPSAVRAEFAARYDGVGTMRYLTVDTPGLSNARNIAAETSTADYIIYLDDDAVPVPHWLDEILKTFAFAGDRAGAIGGKVIPNFGVPKPPWLHDKLLGYLSVVDWLGAELRELTADEWIVGANMGFVRAQLLALGGFDRTLGRKGAGAQMLLGGEDDQMVALAVQDGRGIFYNPKAEVAHYIPAERLQRDWFRRRLAWNGVGNQLLQSLPKKQELTQWQDVLAFSKQAQGMDNGLLALVADTDDPELFLLQAQAIRSFTRLLLGKGEFPVPLTM